MQGLGPHDLSSRFLFLHEHRGPVKDGNMPTSLEDITKVDRRDDSPPLLFLSENRTAKKSAAERKMIHVHVQKDHHRKQRNAAIRRLQNGAWKTAVNPTSTSLMPTDARPNSAGQRALRPAQETALKQEIEDPVSDNQLSRESSDTVQADEEFVWGHDPMCCVGVAALDPFVMASIIPSTPANHILTHYVKLIVPIAYPLKGQALWATRQILQLAFDESIVLHSILAVSSVQELAAPHVGVIPVSTHATSADHLRHKLKTIRMINSAMANPAQATRTSTLFAIWNISLIETLSGNTNEKNLHFRGVDQILTMRGGFQGLPDFLVESLVSGFISNWAVTGETPRHLPAPYTGTISVKTAATVAQSSAHLSDLLTGFTDSALTSFLSPDMLKLIKDLREYILIREYVNNSPRDVPQEDRNVTAMKGLDIEYRIVALRPRKPCSQIEDALSIPLLLLKDDLYEIHNPTSSIHVDFTARVKETFNNTDLFRPEWKPAHEAVVWILSLCAWHSDGDPWFFKKLAKLLQLLKIRSWDQFKSLLSRFGYVARIFERPMKKIWNEVEGMDLPYLKQTRVPSFRAT